MIIMKIVLNVVNLQTLPKKLKAQITVQKPKLIAVKSEQIVVSRRFPGLLFCSGVVV